MPTPIARANGEPAELFPSLPLEAWEESKETLHRYVQIVGKIRLATAAPRNHWWHVPLCVTTPGLTTDPLPDGDRTFALDFDFVDHRLVQTTSDGAANSFPLNDGLSVAEFYRQVFALLAARGIKVAILAKPFDLTPAELFPTDTAHAAYDASAVSRWWGILVQIDQILQEFAGRFTGKTSPVHLFWHSFDLAVTRFSGRRAPDLGDVDPITREAYSHEVISFGFWAGDARVRAPAFYAYTAPEPPGLTSQPLQPSPATWSDTGRGSLALLLYEDLRRLPAPKPALLDFLESAYQAGARTAGWDAAAFAASPRSA
jgi:hypothetical protein